LRQGVESADRLADRSRQKGRGLLLQSSPGPRLLAIPRLQPREARTCERPAPNGRFSEPSQRPRLAQYATTWVRGPKQLRQKPGRVRAVCAFQHAVHGRKLCWASNGSRPRQRRRAAQRPEQRRLNQSALLIPSVVSAVSCRANRTLSAAVRRRLSKYLMHQPGSKARPAAAEKGANYQAQHRRNPDKREDDDNELHLDSPHLERTQA